MADHDVSVVDAPPHSDVDQSDADDSDREHVSDLDVEFVERERKHQSDMAELQPSDQVDGVDDSSQALHSTSAKPKYDPKDPNRPRRKKARRACYACQRAHLTCGDERPCQRCIKRGLADVCQDGVRKKAKYLHDTPLEALRPVLGPSFGQLNDGRMNSIVPATSSPVTEPSLAIGPRGQYYPVTDNTSPYPSYSAQMPPPIHTRTSYSSQQSPVTSVYHTPTAGMAQSELHPLRSSPHVDMPSPWSGLPYDNNPVIFPYDIGDLQFDSQYGAMEFSMLAQLSDAVAKTPDGGMLQQPYDLGADGAHYSHATGEQQPPHQHQLLPDYVSIDSLNAGGLGGQQYHPMSTQAYTIAYNNHTSPSTDTSQNASVLFYDSPGAFQSPPALVESAQKVHDPRPGSRSQAMPSSVLGKRSRDSSSIYDTVQEPYSYTAGFHGLTACLQRRFSPSKTLQIAKSLASIRPSFISCTKSLNRQDLIFMEKCFQRTLFEYDELMLNCCTPTLVCRRTGEVAAVNKEFIMLSGWARDILLGHEPNLNVNMGTSGDEKQAGKHDSSAIAQADSSRARSAVRPRADAAGGKAQPVFLAELLDDESVIEFYENFAKLAFGDARGSVKSRGKLLKYQTEDDASAVATETLEVKGKGTEVEPRVKADGGKHGFSKLEKDGKIDCAYCWTVKRDVFDIPMLIIMNFLPCI